MEFTQPKKYKDEEGDKKLDQSILKKLMAAPNIAAILPYTELHDIGQACLRGYEIDLESRKDWIRINEQAMKLASQLPEAKSFPWPNAANVKYPLITTSAIQFHARAYPALVQGKQIAKGVVNGADPDGQKKDRADRIGKHMSYQLLNEMEDWEEDTDKLLLNLSIMGCNFRKSYFDPMKGVNASSFIPAERLIVNHGAKNLETAPRITEELPPFYQNDIEERERSGVFIQIDAYPKTEDDEPVDFLEQHTWIDLDEDGYKEPYVVTLHKETGSVVRILPRYIDEDVEIIDNRIVKIKPLEFYTKYSFIPNPDGGFYDIGLGALLTPLSDTINTVVNQILDAGTAQNAGGGFIGSGLRLKAGSLRFAPGEYKPVNQVGGVIRDNIVNFPHSGPSGVLFEMLGLLIEAGKDISSVKDILTGETKGANESPTTTLALIEQGQKVFTAIYKRIHRSLGKELKKLFKLNQMYLPAEAYFRVMDEQQTITLEDYQGDSTAVTPISDPNMSTDAQEMARAEAYMKFNQDPLVNQMEIRKRYFKALKEENIDTILNKNPQPDPMMLQQQLEEMQQEGQKLQQEYEEFQQQAKDMAAKLKEENDTLRMSLANEKAESFIQSELDKVESAKQEVVGEIEKAIETLESEKEKMSSDVQIKVTQAINDVKNLIAQHEITMQGLIQSAKSEEGEKKDPVPEMQQRHQEFMDGVGSIMQGLQSLTETMQRPRTRKLVMDEYGEPVAAIETME